MAAHCNLTPPRPPWAELNFNSASGGYLSIYYSDDMSRLPVRWVTKPGDNKSDPNLETMTYGMFSTCGRGMRAGIVKRNARFLFFATRWKGRRVLAGYYRLHWFTTGTFGQGDFCISARSAHFVSDPIALSEVDRECGTDLSAPFRGTRLLTAGQCQSLAKLLNAQPDATEEYLSEIDRLERFNLRHGGFRYVNWKRKDKFSWAHAAAYLPTAVKGQSMKSNKSTSNYWVCSACERKTWSESLLKLCPHCGEPSTLIAADSPQSA